MMKPTAHSTAEAELMAADELARNIAWLRTLFKEIGIEQTEPTVMYKDNEAFIKISEGGGSFLCGCIGAGRCACSPFSPLWRVAPA